MLDCNGPLSLTAVHTLNCPGQKIGNNNPTMASNLPPSMKVLKKDPKVYQFSLFVTHDHKTLFMEIMIFLGALLSANVFYAK